jgi:hypothetical protein
MQQIDPLSQIKRKIKLYGFFANVNFYLMMWQTIIMLFQAILNEPVLAFSVFVFFLSFVAFWINKEKQNKLENVLKFLEETNGKGL